MILMGVIAIVSKDDIGSDLRLKFFKTILHGGAFEGQKAIAKSAELESLHSGASREQFRAASCLRFANAGGAEHDPMKCASWVLCSDPQNRSPASDLDVVRVCAETQDRERLANLAIETQVDHLACSAQYLECLPSRCGADARQCRFRRSFAADEALISPH